MKHFFSTLMLWLCLPFAAAFAQQVKNNDCINVFLANRFICGNASFTTDNVNGRGAINDFGPQYQNSSGCLNPQNGFVEVQAAWYAFKIQTTGKLTLDLIPLGAHDYDFAIFGPNKPCNALGAPVRCSFAANPTSQNGYKTGMSLDAGDASEPASGDGYVKYLDVIEGQMYYILINNWSNQNAGFQLFWGGTGKIANSIAEFTPIVSCNVVNFNNLSTACDGTLSYEWDFGDGSPITSENFKKVPVHYYENPGTYTIKLKTVITASSSDENIGVVATQTKQVTVSKAPPAIQIPVLKDKYCVDEPDVTLAATPTGGTFSIKKNQVGNFVDNQTIFSPATLGVGKHEVKYTYQDPADIACKSVKIKVVEVFALPTVDLNSLQSGYCISTAAFDLVGNPTGGTFKIDGNTATSFNPTSLGVGAHTVKYDYANPTSGCSATVSKQVTVYAMPTLSFTNVRDAYCLAGSAFTMQASPAGGTFKVNNSVNSTFDIPALGVGTHTVEYSYTSPEGCASTISKQVQIAEKPTITFVGILNEYCESEAAFNLQATPAGGTFKIDGNIATQFDATALGAGDHTIVYSYADPNDATCANTASKTVSIRKAPKITLADVESNYCKSYTAQVSPKFTIVYSNGTTTVDIPVNLAFTPSLLPAGEHIINYTAQDPATGCTTPFQKKVNINALPEVNFVGLGDSYCQQSFPIVLKASPTGGTFTINGLAMTELKPRDFAVGDKPTVKYDFTDANGCSSSVSKQVEITAAGSFTPIARSFDICPQPVFYVEALTLEEEAIYKQQGITPKYYWNHTQDDFRFIIIRDKSQEGDYEVSVRDQSGCPIAQKSFKVKVNCEPRLFVPTAFTPNNDNQNDYLEIFGEDFIKLDFKVFNRWGEVVFTARSKKEMWDGMLGGKPAPTGVYTWKASYENSIKKGEVFQKQGMFVLIR